MVDINYYYMIQCLLEFFKREVFFQMNIKRERLHIVIAGLIIGVIASLLVFFGNPANMGFCIACFLRDTAGGLGLHRAAAVQYIRPEIIGLVLGSFGIALFKGEFSAKGGSAPLTRFVLGFFVMIGCLMFLGCPFRMILRLAGGDLNALLGGLGFVLGILAGVFFLKKGYSLKRSYSMAKLEGFLFPAIQVVVFILLVAAPAFIYFTEAGGGPGAKHAAVLISLAAGLIVGALAQRTRLCMVGGIRDVVLFREPKLLMGFGAILISALVCNLILTGATDGTYFHLAFEGQPHRPYRRPVELPGHGAGGLWLRAAGRLPPATAGALRRGQLRQRRDGAGPDRGRCLCP